jgi:hypothetical protein
MSMSISNCQRGNDMRVGHGERVRIMEKAQPLLRSGLSAEVVVKRLHLSISGRTLRRWFKPKMSEMTQVISQRELSLIRENEIDKTKQKIWALNKAKVIFKSAFETGDFRHPINLFFFSFFPKIDI